LFRPNNQYANAEIYIIKYIMFHSRNSKCAIKASSEFDKHITRRFHYRYQSRQSTIIDLQLVELLFWVVKVYVLYMTGNIYDCLKL